MEITLCDVGPRDGLQNESVVLAPTVRAEYARRLAGAGLPRVEAGSFVSPRHVPSMAGAEEVFAALPPHAGTVYAALVLNERGFERAVAASAGRIHVAYPVTDTFALRNQHVTAEEGARIAAAIVRRGHAVGLEVAVTLSAAFGCPFEGRVDPGVVLHHVRLAAAAGADDIVLADTIGAGVPSGVRALVPAALDAAAGAPIGLHLHNTRNTGYANADAGLEAGATLLDASTGGLGGCPFAPRATGNIATEDLVHMLDAAGVRTGVDLDALLGVAAWLAGVLDRDLPGLVARAGRFPAAAAG